MDTQSNQRWSLAIAIIVGGATIFGIGYTVGLNSMNDSCRSELSEKESELSRKDQEIGRKDIEIARLNNEISWKNKKLSDAEKENNELRFSISKWHNLPKLPEELQNLPSISNEDNLPTITNEKPDSLNEVAKQFGLVFEYMVQVNHDLSKQIMDITKENRDLYGQNRAYEEEIKYKDILLSMTEDSKKTLSSEIRNLKSLAIRMQNIARSSRSSEEALKKTVDDLHSWAKFVHRNVLLPLNRNGFIPRKLDSVKDYNLRNAIQTYRSFDL